jgi:long-chain acyl-CoA synthetase
MNVAQHVERGRSAFPSRTALIFEGRLLSYAELDRLASRCANLLAALGIGFGDRVVLFLPNIPEFVVAYLGVLKLGAICVSASAMLQEPELAYLLDDSGARLVITTAELRGRVPGRDGGAPWQILIAEGPADAAEDLARMLEQARDRRPAARVRRHTPAAIVYTSGTTGHPKGAVLSHGNIQTCMAAKRRYCGTGPADRMLLFLPLFHCFGQNAILNHGLHAGATIVLQRRFAPDQVAESIVRDRISMFFGVPTAFIRMLDHAGAAALAGLRYSLTAGASMPVEVARRWRGQVGRPAYEGYGLTETSPFASYNHARRYQLGSVGTPIAGVEMAVVDPLGQPLPPGERGEIVIRGPNVMLAYWNRPEETAAALRGGWFHTGDIGVRDDAGYFAVVDRLKDMINVAGFKVYPAEVEQVLYQHPAVAEAAVFAGADPLRGESVRAHVCLKAGQTCSPEELIGFCRDRIALVKVPSSIALVDTLPKSPTGKILRRLLRDQDAQRTGPSTVASGADAASPAA